MMPRTILMLALLALGLFFAPQSARAQVQSPGPYVSEVRDQCIEEMAKDAQIRVACMSQYSDEYHEQDARQATKNKQFVVAAYAALWAIVAIFVVILWLRQRKLSAEITRLETELKKAASE